MNALLPSTLSAGLLRRRVRLAATQNGQPVRPLPLRRTTPALQPIVSRPTRTAENVDDFCRAERSDVVFESHSGNVAGGRNIGNAENKALRLSALPTYSKQMKRKLVTLHRMEDEGLQVWLGKIWSKHFPQTTMAWIYEWEKLVDEYIIFDFKTADGLLDVEVYWPKLQGRMRKLTRTSLTNPTRCCFKPQ